MLDALETFLLDNPEINITATGASTQTPISFGADLIFYSEVKIALFTHLFSIEHLKAQANLKFFKTQN